MTRDFIVCIATIPPRFSGINRTIQSWLSQTVIPKEIILFVPTHYNMFGPYDINDLKYVIKSLPPTQTIIKIISGSDFGASNQVVCALEYYYALKGIENTDFVISDDDCIYNNNIIESYRDKKTESKTILTHYRPFQNGDVLRRVSSADSYLIPNEFFKDENIVIYTSYLSSLFKECPEFYFNADLVFSFRAMIYGYNIKSIRTDVVSICFDLKDQIHDDPGFNERQMVVKKYIEAFIMNL